uniref:Mpv17-like protein 2 n=1 Tax=Glossina morsitans morsitans TaxID=37546 RepID=A0A1B0GG97_GLOMM
MFTRTLQRFRSNIAVPLLKNKGVKLSVLHRHQLLKTTIVKCEPNQKNNRNINGSRGWTSNLRIFWNNVFGKYLLFTNIAGSGILMVVGDVMAQEIEVRKGAPNSKRYDLERMGRMFVAGALMGPLHHYVYNWMEKVMPVPNLRNTIRKILIDQIFMSPACLLIFFYSACFLERKTIAETNAELKEKFLYIYLIDWLFWPGAQYVNFRYLDIKYRVTYVNVCTALYDVFISYVKHLYEDAPIS